MSASAPKYGSTTGAPSSIVVGRLLVYLRQSLNEDRNTHGIEAQRGINERFAVAHSLPWGQRLEFTDVGYSRDDANRPEYKRLLAEAREGDTILIWERSRLGVDLNFVVAVHYLAKQCRARILVASGEPLDPSDIGLVMEHLRGNQDGAELRRIRVRTRDKLRERVLKGYVASKLPYGLESYPENPADPTSLKLGRKVPVEEAVLIRIVDLFLDGMGKHKIARTLNSDGVPSPRDEARTMLMKKGQRAGQTVTTTGRWCGSHISDILANPVYRGQYIFGVRGGKGGKIPPVSVEHPEWVIGDLDMWARVDEAMAARATDMPAKLNAAKHTLSGIGRCACGGSLSMQKDGRPGKKVMSYQCSRRRRGLECTETNFIRIRADLIEDAIRLGLDAWFDGARAAFGEIVREVEARIASQAAPDVSAIERELTAARGEQQHLVRLVMATGGEVDAVAAALKTGQANIKRLEAAHVRATAPRADARAIGQQIEAAAVQRLDALRAALRGPNAREALRALFPQGLLLRADTLAYHLEAEGVLPSEGIPDGIPSVGRIPFLLSIPKAA